MVEDTEDTKCAANTILFWLTLLAFLVSEALPFLERFFNCQCRVSGIAQGIINLIRLYIEARDCICPEAGNEASSGHLPEALEERMKQYWSDTQSQEALPTKK